MIATARRQSLLFGSQANSCRPIEGSKRGNHLLRTPVSTMERRRVTCQAHRPRGGRSVRIEVVIGGVRRVVHRTGWHFRHSAAGSAYMRSLKSPLARRLGRWCRSPSEGGSATGAATVPTPSSHSRAEERAWASVRLRRNRSRAHFSRRPSLAAAQCLHWSFWDCRSPFCSLPPAERLQV